MLEGVRVYLKFYILQTANWNPERGKVLLGLHDVWGKRPWDQANLYHSHHTKHPSLWAKIRWCYFCIFRVLSSCASSLSGNRIYWNYRISPTFWQAKFRANFCFPEITQSKPKSFNWLFLTSSFWDTLWFPRVCIHPGCSDDPSGPKGIGNCEGW